jgi:RimJ/RimL family protein N-acetyltransferase
MESPNLQPTLAGSRVIVRPVVASDWGDMFAAAADPEIWALHPVRDRYTEPVFCAYFDSALASGSAFSIVERASGHIIGSSRYHDHDPERREIEIGWTFLTRPYWGGSYNREIKDLMLTHAFTFVDTVVFWVGEANWRSQRAMEKIGGVCRADPGIRALDGKNHSHVVFEIRKDNYKQPLCGPGDG